MVVVNTVTSGTNADLIAAVGELYLKDGDVVVDVTYAGGTFWKKTDVTRFDFRPSDIEPKTSEVAKLDCRNLPYEDASVDVLVLDPPYIHTPGIKGKLHATDNSYNNAATTGGMYNYDILHKLYKPAMTEAKRVLKPHGFLWVKGQNQVEAGVQRWNDIELFNVATVLGFYGRDKFLYIQPGGLPVRGVQRHAKKKDSFLWVFENTDPSLKKVLRTKE